MDTPNPRAGGARQVRVGAKKVKINPDGEMEIDQPELRGDGHLVARITLYLVWGIILVVFLLVVSAMGKFIMGKVDRGNENPAKMHQGS